MRFLVYEVDLQISWVSYSKVHDASDFKDFSKELLFQALKILTKEDLLGPLFILKTSLYNPE